MAIHRHHWNAECVGACVQARRPLALQPHGARGATSAGAARGLAADRSRLPGCGGFDQPDQVLGLQVRHRRTAPDQRRAERFNRTLKAQIIHGRIYRNIADLPNAVRGFVEQYNAQWIVEKNGYLRLKLSGVAHRDLRPGDNTWSKEPGATF